jgi:hypothetical protein
MKDLKPTAPLKPEKWGEFLRPLPPCVESASASVRERERTIPQEMASCERVCECILAGTSGVWVCLTLTRTLTLKRLLNGPFLPHPPHTTITFWCVCAPTPLLVWVFA